MGFHPEMRLGVSHFVRSRIKHYLKLEKFWGSKVFRALRAQFSSYNALLECFAFLGHRQHKCSVVLLVSQDNDVVGAKFHSITYCFSVAKFSIIVSLQPISTTF